MVTDVGELQLPERTARLRRVRAVTLLALVWTLAFLLGGTTTSAAAVASPARTTHATTYAAALDISEATSSVGLDGVTTRAPGEGSAASVRDVSASPSVFLAADEGAAGGGALVKSGWPASGGFLGDTVETTLKPGAVVDRYGGPGGSYVSPKGTPFGNRGLPAYYENAKPYYQYEVVQPVTVRGGTVALAPAFGGGGGGVQYQFGTSVQDLIDSGVLKQVGP